MQIPSLAGCVTTDGRGYVLLLHRNTPALTHWELPGGKLEKDETEAIAALRETEEEAGVKVESAGVIGQTTFTDVTGTWSYTWIRAESLRANPGFARLISLTTSAILICFQPTWKRKVFRPTKQS